jgi:hypothetical protein
VIVSVDGDELRPRSAADASGPRPAVAPQAETHNRTQILQTIPPRKSAPQGRQDDRQEARQERTSSQELRALGLDHSFFDPVRAWWRRLARRD